MNNFGLNENTMRVLLEKISAHSEVEKAVIFGSRAKGNYKKGSDVDIALFGKQLSFEIVITTQAELNEHTTQPYYFDIINYHTVEIAMQEHIDRVGIIIFDKSNK